MVRGLCGRSRSGRRGDCGHRVDHADDLTWRADRAWGSGSRGRGVGAEISEGRRRALHGQQIVGTAFHGEQIGRGMAAPAFHG
jgi:hypothetical protein